MAKKLTKKEIEKEDRQAKLILIIVFLLIITVSAISIVIKKIQYDRAELKCLKAETEWMKTRSAINRY